MNKFNRLVGTPIFLSALALPAFVIATGCDGKDALCCTDFKVGADLGNVDLGVEGTAKGTMTAFAQASGDLSATAQAMVDDVTNACRNIAIDLDQPADKRLAASRLGGRDAMNAWCGLAIDAITAVKAAGTLTIAVIGGRCDINVSVKARCQAQCDVNGTCDIKATPPTCKGGKLVVDCKGQCDATVESPSISCTGSCMGTCSGTCAATVQAPMVACDGTCDGTCTGSGGAGNNGIQTDGTCKGTCSGSCTARPGSASVACSGSCQGSCTGSCAATPGSASVQCSGRCTGDFEPLTCEGGTLEGGCEVDAKCDANCSGSAQAKADCTPPELTITLSAMSNAAAIRATLEENLPAILGIFRFQGKAFVDAAGSVAASGSASVSAVVSSPSIKGTACLAAIGTAVSEAVQNGTAAFTISGSVAGKLGVPAS